MILILLIRVRNSYEEYVLGNLIQTLQQTFRQVFDGATQESLIVPQTIPRLLFLLPDFSDSLCMHDKRKIPIRKVSGISHGVLG